MFFRIMTVVSYLDPLAALYIHHLIGSGMIRTFHVSTQEFAQVG
jgi:hypothetical protein